MIARVWRRYAAAFLVTVLPSVLAGCETAPATGESFFTGGLSLAQEERLGAQEHPKILQQFGGAYDDPELQAYVSSIGNLLAQTSELPELDWTFTILDTPVVNAFALPGGYVYVTRGLMALADDEAQLAGVLGHEIGHVTARHSAQRHGAGILAGVGGLATSILLGSGASQAVGVLSEVALSGYSRQQEFEADTLGVRYLSRAGYHPDSMARFLEKMHEESRLQAQLRGDPDAADGFNLLQTHPRTPQRAREAAAQAGVRPVDDPMVERELYLQKIDGMPFGYSRAEGFVRENRFLHPELRFAFEVPPDFQLLNARRQVVATGPQDTLIIFDTGGGNASSDPLFHLTDQWARGARLSDVERIEINGMRAATGRTRLQTREGPRDARLVAIAYDDQTIYRFLFLTPPALTDRLNEPLRQTTYSFRKLSQEEAEALEPLRLMIHTVRDGETQSSLAERMPFTSHRLERFRVLNGLRPGDELRPGQKVKLVAG